MASEFRTALKDSFTCEPTAIEILLSEIPGALSVTRSTTAQDRQGIDYTVATATGKQIAIDVKCRSKDYGQDLALETWSSIESRSVGWTRNESKHTDFVLWIWADTGRYHIAPFAPLCQAMQAHWEQWASEYKTSQQRSYDSATGNSWTSQVVFVPTQVVTTAINGVGQCISLTDPFSTCRMKPG